MGLGRRHLHKSRKKRTPPAITQKTTFYVEPYVDANNEIF